MTKTYTVPPPPPHNEGKTPAAWTLSLGVVIGITLAALGMVIAMPALLVVGIVVAALSVVAGVVMSVVGLGKKRPARSAATS
ncbi:HGxxPAAW family protein [Brachybacterium squillarum]|uniref:HGxxPAAW family protein n=1 Tax=Brachybacterium squillarum TaxID=661979 RepID=UPI00222281B0|nr:HGxxPAAW family protein [Brachybacterium squillarum]MCW1803686.1 hypothetical protein [Brachybacterium squillarum]